MMKKLGIGKGCIAEYGVHFIDLEIGGTYVMITGVFAFQTT